MFGQYLRYIYLKKMANIFLAVSQHVTNPSLKQALVELHSEGMTIQPPNSMRKNLKQAVGYVFATIVSLIAFYLLLAIFTDISRNKITSAVWGVPLLETILFVLPIGGLYRIGANQVRRSVDVLFKVMSALFFLFYYSVHFMTYCYPLLPHLIAYGWAIYYLLLILILVYPITRTKKIMDGLVISLLIHVAINTVITVLQSV